MTDFDKRLVEAITGEKPVFHGAVFKGIDKSGA
jgi:hypothetical protein